MQLIFSRLIRKSIVIDLMYNVLICAHCLAEKTVLVALEDRSQPVTFAGNKDELLKEIKVIFKTCWETVKYFFK